MILKTILHGQMTEKKAFEVRPKKGKKFQKVIFYHFDPWGVKKLYHMKFKSKISYLGEKINILPWQMAEQLAVEVDVKNVTDVRTDTRTSSIIWLVYTNPQCVFKSYLKRICQACRAGL